MAALARRRYARALDVVDREKIERDLAVLLKHAQQRSQRAGALGCASVFALVFVLAPLGLFESRGGWIVVVVGFFVVHFFLGRRAARQNAEEFRNFCRAGGNDLERRELALASLWRRAQPSARDGKPNTTARDILRELGQTIDPRTAARGAADEGEGTREAAYETSARPPPVVRTVRDVESAPPPQLPPKRDAPSTPRAHATPHAPQVPPHAPAQPRVEPPRTPPPATHAHTPPQQPLVPPHDALASTPPVSAWAGTRPASTRSANTTPASTFPASTSPAPKPGAAAPAQLSVSPARELRCDYCGSVRKLAHGEPLTSCPVCFPQIQLGS